MAEKGIFDNLINAVTDRDEKAAAEAAKKEAEAARAQAEQEAALRREAEAKAAAAEAARSQAEQEAATNAAAEMDRLRQELEAEKAARREMEQAAKAKAQTYVVKSGDSLSKIAKEIYGDAKRWPEIFEANRDKIKDPNLIHPGQELRIP